MIRCMEERGEEISPISTSKKVAVFPLLFSYYCILMVSTQSASHRLTKISIGVINISSSKWVLKLFSKNEVMLKLKFHSDQSCLTKITLTPSLELFSIQGEYWEVSPRISKDA